MLASVSPGARISEMDDSATRVLPQTDGSDSFAPSGLSGQKSRPPIRRYAEMPKFRHVVNAGPTTELPAFLEFRTSRLRES
jgi:hypothetical protein